MTILEYSMTLNVKLPHDTKSHKTLIASKKIQILAFANVDIVS
jgi:hypothetical protein